MEEVPSPIPHFVADRTVSATALCIPNPPLDLPGICRSYGCLPSRRFDMPLPIKHIDYVPEYNSAAQTKNLYLTTTKAVFFSREETLADPSFVRSYHPALAGCPSVALVGVGDGVMWVVYDCDASGYVCAGGIDVHVVPSMVLSTASMGRSGRRDPVPYLIDPSGYLSDEELLVIRDYFPRCRGARMLRAGYLTVQFSDKNQLHEVDCDAISDTFGGLRLGFEVSDHQMYDLTAEGQEGEVGGPYVGEAVCPAGSSLNGPKACMGLKLRLVDGREVITTVTHAFVALYQHRYPRDHFKNFIVSQAKDATMRISKVINELGFIKKVTESIKISSARPPREPESSVSARVFHEDPNEQIGVISECFDTPDSCYPFPHGFPHDLSLISATPNAPLPVIDTPPNIPRITGWASMEEVADHSHGFVAHQLSNKNWRKMEGNIFCAETRQVLLAGTEYSWDEGYRQVNVALLWRTAETGNDHDSAQGMSGSPICLEVPGEEITAKVVCFQNLQSWLRTRHLRNNTKSRMLHGGNNRYAKFKVGFLLPESIRDSAILNLPPPLPEPSTLPRPPTSDGAGGLGEDGGRRVFSI